MKTITSRLTRFAGFLLALSVFLILLVQPLPVLLGYSSGQWRIDGNTSATAAVAMLLLLLVAWAERDPLSRWARWVGGGFSATMGLIVWQCYPWIVKNRGSVRIHLIAGGLVLLGLLLPWVPKTCGRIGAGAWSLWSRVLKVRVVGALLLMSFSFWILSVPVLLPMEFFLRTDYSFFHCFGRQSTGMPQGIRKPENSLGFIGQEYSQPKPEGVTRILVLGDSITRGHGVFLEQAYTSLLQKRLGADYEVINISRNGWSTWDQLEALQTHGFSFEPDLIVLGLCMNDVEPPAEEDDGLGRPVKCFRRIPLNLSTGRLLDEYLNSALEGMALRQSYTVWLESMYGRDGYFPTWLASVRQLRLLCTEQAVPVCAITLPTQNTATELKLFGEKHAILAKAFADEGIPTLDLWPMYLEKYQTRPFRSLWATPNDAHPNAELHAFYAGRLERFLKELGHL